MPLKDLLTVAKREEFAEKAMIEIASENVVKQAAEQSAATLLMFRLSMHRNTKWRSKILTLSLSLSSGYLCLPEGRPPMCI